MLSGIIFDIKHFAVHDGPGIRTTVFFKGCPLKCAWCHNPESINPNPEIIKTVRMIEGKRFHQESVVGRKISVEELMYEIEKDRIIMEESKGGVTFSGGEPLMQPDFLKAILQVCKDKAIHTVVDTSGFASEAGLKKIIPLTQLFLFDLKTLNPELHYNEVGVPLEKVLNNFKLIKDYGNRIRLRIPVIPGFNFTDENLDLYLEFIANNKLNLEGVHLLPYHSIANHKYIKVGKTNNFKNKSSLDKKDLLDWMNKISEIGIPVSPEG